MSLIKLALDNSAYDPTSQNYRGLKTSRMWAYRGVGALTGASIGATIDGGFGTLVGAAIGAGIGDISAISRTMYENAKRDKLKHPLANALLSDKAFKDTLQHTPVSSALAQLSPGAAISGSIMRTLNR